MLHQKRSLLDPENNVESSFELLVAGVDIFFAQETNQLWHDGLVAVRKCWKARTQGVLSPDADVAVVRGGLE